MKVKIIKGPLFKERKKQAYELIYQAALKKVSQEENSIGDKGKRRLSDDFNRERGNGKHQ
ncbi:hypothetical protein C0971_14685 [Bacillus methanolicus]|uniref:hypothetical protein n=1 Tax=Bacillus methanolicus TaxID=1471 RepID=UPI00200E4D02|nr:hypothetical protein [Bacillus methanolicus]UQD53130.1 hypothetical protein C0971_14685 [Bacillus methanolicus]